MESWLALIRDAQSGDVLYCSVHHSHQEASEALVEYRRRTAVGFGTQFIIATCAFCIEA
jgi:hypothetical protein